MISLYNAGENMKEERKKKIYLMLLGIVGLVVLMTGMTYAIFQYAQAGNIENVITTGSLKLTLTEGNEINVTDALPMLDAQGLASTGFDFTLENEGIVPVNYTIYLDNVALSGSDVALDESFLKYSFDINGVAGTANTLTSLGSNGSRILTSGVIAEGAINSYVLRVWITADIDADIQGQVWKGKIRLEGSQIQQ